MEPVTQGTVRLALGEPAVSPAIDLPAQGLLPACRLTTEARIPDNHELTYAATLRDDDGYGLFSVHHDARRETGEWKVQGTPHRSREADTHRTFLFVVPEPGAYELRFAATSLRNLRDRTDPATEVQVDYVVERHAAPLGVLWGSFAVWVGGLAWAVGVARWRRRVAIAGGVVGAIAAPSLAAFAVLGWFGPTYRHVEDPSILAEAMYWGPTVLRAGAAPNRIRGGREVGGAFQGGRTEKY